jgi:hypothetical protein
VRLRKQKRAAVLGCGPAGLFAAHALETIGYDVTVFSVKRRSEMFGAQYLHEPIPGVSGAPFRIDYQLRGTAEGYAEKVYGNSVEASAVSPASLQGSHKAWDIRHAYYALWDVWVDRISHVPIDAATANAIQAAHNVTISSIPAPVLCSNDQHAFTSQNVWAIGDAPERGQIVSNVFQVPPNNTVICSGERHTGWYRSATILRYSTIEWPAGRKPPMSNVAGVQKPIATTCNCLPKIMRVGRYGAWTKGILSHTAYTSVWERYS